MKKPGLSDTKLLLQYRIDEMHLSDIGIDHQIEIYLNYFINKSVDSRIRNEPHLTLF